MKILVSACLLGIHCRYNGSTTASENILNISSDYCLIPVCPEQIGGLRTPRPPSEIKDGRVITKTGEDVTEEYNRGAAEVLKIAKLFDCEYAILQERSPSCGCGKIYDGTFTGKLIDGNGVTADLLLKNGIKVVGDSKVTDLIKSKK